MRILSDEEKQALVDIIQQDPETDQAKSAYRQLLDMGYTKNELQRILPRPPWLY